MLENYLVILCIFLIRENRHCLPDVVLSAREFGSSQAHHIFVSCLSLASISTPLAYVATMLLLVGRCCCDAISIQVLSISRASLSGCVSYPIVPSFFF